MSAVVIPFPRNAAHIWPDNSRSPLGALVAVAPAGAGRDGPTPNARRYDCYGEAFDAVFALQEDAGLPIIDHCALKEGQV